MTLWAAGPLDLEIAKTCPSRWPLAAGDGHGLVKVDVSSAWEQLAYSEVPDAPHVDAHHIEVRHAGPQLLQLKREIDAFTATINYETSKADYRGMLDFWPTGELPIFESFLRVLTAGWLLRRGGGLWHGSGVVIDGETYVFVGLSGAGKTTLVANTKDEEYLSDDQTIIFPNHDGVMEAWATPFSGNLGRRAIYRHHAPLRAIVLLSSERPEATELAPMTPGGSTAAQLLRHLCSFERTPAEATMAFEHVMSLINSVPVFSLRRHLNDSVYDLVEQLRDVTRPAIDRALPRQAPLRETPATGSPMPDDKALESAA